MAILKKYGDGGKGKIVPITSPTFTTYKEKLKMLENDRQAGFKPEQDKWYKHNKDTIGYGHLVLPGEDFSKGVSTQKINDIYDQDFQNHRYWAMKKFDEVYGPESFHKLKPEAQVLVADYAYNLGANKFMKKFPSFMTAIHNNDKAGMLAEYERTDLPERNKFTKEYIEKNF